MNLRPSTSVSTLTQTWQVGPGRAVYSGSSSDDAENTLTSLPVRSVFRIFSRTGVLLRVIDLALGTHSFFLEENGSVGHCLGRHPRAEFEINIYTEGGFFVDVTGRRSALVNGRDCFWARLRSGDEIIFGREKWILEAADSISLEETFARTRLDGKREVSVVVVPEAPIPTIGEEESRLKPRPRAKLIVFVGVAALSTSLLSAYIGYGLAKEQQVTFVAGKRSIAQDLPPEEIELEHESVIEKHVDLDFNEAALGKVLDSFRAGAKEEACSALAANKRSLEGNGLWAKKGRMLFERRCR